MAYFKVLFRHLPDRIVGNKEQGRPESLQARIWISNFLCM